MTIAATILQQLGGSRFIAMTGAKNLINHGSALSMKLPRNASKANMLKITLDANDTYTVEFSKFRNLDITPVKTLNNVYADQLRSVFTATTGLETSL